MLPLPNAVARLVPALLALATLLTARASFADDDARDLDIHLDDISLDDVEDFAIESRFVPDDIPLRSPLTKPSMSGGPRGSASLSLGAFTERRSDGYSEQGGLLLLQIPLERFANNHRHFELLSSSSFQDDDAEPAEPGDEGSEAALGRGEILDARILPSMARLCVHAALRAHGLLGDSRVDSLASRARMSAALPELRLRATRATDASLRLSPTQYDPYRYTEGEAAGHRMEARVSWRLDRLLFADQEVSLERVRLQRLDARSKLSTKVLRALFDWQRARALALDPVISPEEEAAAALRLFEAEMALEVLTGGGCSLDGESL